MDQIKIGMFIAECRKKKNLTQVQLSEKLNITDRAISKWETGKAVPGSDIMLDECENSCLFSNTVKKIKKVLAKSGKV